jgi:hypothetical protein
MRAALPLLFAASQTWANTLPYCPFGEAKGQLQCEDIEPQKQTLLHSALPGGLRANEIQQNMNQLFFQVELGGTAAGREGDLIRGLICGLPEWRDLLNRDYRMSVRMTHKQGDLVRLDEIAFIEDCEAD